MNSQEGLCLFMRGFLLDKLFFLLHSIYIINYNEHNEVSNNQIPKLLSIQLYNNREKRFFLKTWHFVQQLDKFTRLMLVPFILFIITTPFIVGNLQVFTPQAQTAATISLDP